MPLFRGRLRSGRQKNVEALTMQKNNQSSSFPPYKVYLDDRTLFSECLPLPCVDTGYVVVDN